MRFIVNKLVQLEDWFDRMAERVL